MRKLLVVLAISVALGAFIGLRADQTSFEEELLRADARETLDMPRQAVDSLPPPVLSALLTYSDDEALLLNAQAALALYPRKSRRVIALYGLEPEFREILRDYGASIVPPIHYYLENASYALHVMHFTAEQIERANAVARHVWSGAADEEADEDAGAQTRDDGLTPQARGWYAVNFIRDEGHDFLGQFVVDAGGEVRRVQSQRIVEGTAAFFTSGVRGLEQKYLQDEPLTVGDYAWAGVDLAIVAGAVKILRAGRTAAKGTQAGAAGARTASVTARTGVAARALSRSGRVGLRIAKYGAIPATIVLAVTHPGTVTGLLHDMAVAAGVSPTLALVGGWSLILLPLVFLGMTLMRWLVRPAIAALRMLGAFLRWVHGSAWQQRKLFSA